MRVNKEEYSDNDLVVSYFKSHKTEVLGILYNRYMHLVYGLCLKYLKSREAAQDAVMNIFELITEKMKTQEVTHFKSWLYMVTKNHCLMELRKSDNQQKMNGYFMENEPAVHPNDEALEIDQDLDQLEACLQQLKDDQQQCVRLFYLDQMSYQEIVGRCNMKLSKVKSYIQNGKRNLKICLEKHGVKG